MPWPGRSPRQVVLTTRGGGLGFYTEHPWQLLPLQDLPRAVKASMTESELTLAHQGFGPYVQIRSDGATWERYMVLGGLQAARSHVVLSTNSDDVSTSREDDFEIRYKWRVYNVMRDRWGVRYVELESPEQERPLQPWELGDCQWTLKVIKGVTVIRNAERWQARDRRGGLFDAKVWVQCFGPYENQREVELKLEAAQRVLRRLDACAERLYLYGATPDDAHRELLDGGAWALESHAENGMPAYRRGGARVRMVWLDEHYMVMSDGRPLLRVAPLV